MDDEQEYYEQGRPLQEYPYTQPNPNPIPPKKCFQFTKFKCMSYECFMFSSVFLCLFGLEFKSFKKFVW